MPKDRGMKDLIAEAVECGAVYLGTTSKNHHKIRWGTEVIFLPSTPSCCRSLANTRSLLRRKGVPLPSGRGK